MSAQDILFFDAYDSFTYNIVSLLAEILPLGPDAQIVVQSLHQPLPGRERTASEISDDEFARYLRGFSAVICGPGPGSPLNPTDTGPFSRLWRLSDENMIPVLGVCLGFQSLVAHFGGQIRKLKLGQHGIIRKIEHRGEESGQAETSDIFKDVPSFKATLYHSLCADVGQDDIPEEEWPVTKWTPFTAAPDLEPLAWTTVDLSHDRERVLMAVKHKSKPFWGLQYHPESICTEDVSREVLRKWFEEATAWSKGINRASHVVKRRGSSSGHGTIPTSIEEKVSTHLRSGASPGIDAFADDWLRRERPELACAAARNYACETINLPAGADAASVAEILGETSGSRIILDASSARVNDPLAVQSIIAVDVGNAIRFEHVAKSNSSIRMFVPASQSSDAEWVDLQCTEEVQAWEIISHFWSSRRVSEAELAGATTGVVHGHFKGGFMGYLSYEMGLKTVSPALARAERADDHADLCLAWVTHSIVLDHKSKRAYVQGWSSDAQARTWVEKTKQRLEAGLDAHSQGSRTPKVNTPVTDWPATKKSGASKVRLYTPDPLVYEDKVRQCQREIAEGNSYELCLTMQTIMTRPGGAEKESHSLAATNGYLSCNGVSASSNGLGHTNGHAAKTTKDVPVEAEPLAVKNINAKDSMAVEGRSSPWDIYKALRSRQPAPFGSFIRLGGATLLSSSPERFLRYDAQGLCSMRPMKGTVRKSQTVSTLEDAEKMLRVPKEIAENLMIVDLARHDLHRVCGYGQVTVPEPFKIEEYATVFTMVTGIQGQLNRHLGPSDSQHTPAGSMTGLDVLRSVFPPGSMTGAPKKRSCELLAEIEEHQPRGLYSGVVGYMDVTGAGDWSVTIRSMFRYDDETAEPEPGETERREVWHIGAGGAVTILSTPQGEREEMFTKLEGPLGVFRDMA
ncbi:chorismate binding enzyme domain-containing protein [Sarocladium implicatum]|nr:chorismate binding enzyme domain-containing protein [Sarocladium implicatum]